MSFDRAENYSWNSIGRYLPIAAMGDAERSGLWSAATVEAGPVRTMHAGPRVAHASAPVPRLIVHRSAPPLRAYLEKVTLPEPGANPLRQHEQTFIWGGSDFTYLPSFGQGWATYIVIHVAE